jgi:hypothetical protein
MAKHKEKKQINNVKDVFKIVRLSALLSSFTDINPAGGIYHRINNKSTQEKDKQTNLRDEEKNKLRDALLCLGEQIIDVAMSDELNTFKDEIHP